MDPFGRRIAKQRAELGWTQARLAERIAISRVALSHLEAGMSVANERTVALLAATFGLEPHDLVAGTDYPSAKADRLPLVVARHTEVDVQLMLLAADLRWLDRFDELSGVHGPAAPVGLVRLASDVVERWTGRLATLEAETVDRHERRRVADARAALRSVSAPSAPPR